MALILEVRDRRGATTFHPLNGLPVAVGRALSNDIILDDPYVDAHHVRITPDESGALTVHDLGSVNGVIANGARTATGVSAQAGVELKIGRTTLRFRDRDETMPAAVAETATRLPPVARWAMTRPGGWLIFAATMAFVAFINWGGNTERQSGSSVFAAVMATYFLIGLWAFTWAAATRGPDRRFHAREHNAIACAAVLVVMVYALVNEWLIFFFPDVPLFTVMFAIGTVAVTVGAIVAHLAVAGATRERRRRVAISTVVVVILLTVIAGLVREDKFTDTPKFPSQLKPISAQVVPTHTVGDFVRAMSEARTAADKAVAR